MAVSEETLESMGAMGVILPRSRLPVSTVAGADAGASNAAMVILAAGVVAARATASTTTPSPAQSREAQVGIRDSKSSVLLLWMEGMVIGPCEQCGSCSSLSPIRANRVS